MISRTSQCDALRVQRGIDGEHGRRIADRAQHDGADLRLVQPQAQQRVVQLAERAQRPRLVAGRQELVGRGRGCGVSGAAIVSSHSALGAVDRALSRTCSEWCRRRSPASSGPSVMPGPLAGRSDMRRQLLRAPGDRLLELAGRIHRVDEAPSTARLPRTPSVSVLKSSARSRRTLRLSTTRVRPPVPGSTPSSGVSGRPTDAAAVVHQQDLVAGQRQLVAAAGADAVERGEELDAAVRAHVLHAEARLVGELAEVHLEGVARACRA